MFASYLQLMRPAQWVKNVFVVFPLLFAGDLAELNGVVFAILAFALFSITSSGVYAINDAMDVEADKNHPVKKDRPVASGKISRTGAYVFGTLLLLTSGTASWVLNKNLAMLLALYVTMNLLYSSFLKHVAVIDVMIIALGFIIRILFGSVLSSASPSHWILLTTFFLALFLAVSKRRAELFRLNGAEGGRAVLKNYNLQFLDSLGASLTGITILCYSLYAVSNATEARFGGNAMIYTVPFVVFGLFRYHQLVVVEGKGENPADILTGDVPMWICVLLWGAVCSWAVYF